MNIAGDPSGVKKKSRQQSEKSGPASNGWILDLTFGGTSEDCIARLFCGQTI